MRRDFRDDLYLHSRGDAADIQRGEADRLPRRALGLVFGTAISFSGIVLALAAILTPHQSTGSTRLHRHLCRRAARDGRTHTGRAAHNNRRHNTGRACRTVYHLPRHTGARSGNTGVPKRRSVRRTGGGGRQKKTMSAGRWNRSAEVRPQIGVRNVIGSLVFSITGNLGVILLAGGGRRRSRHDQMASTSAYRVDAGLLSVWRAAEAGHIYK